MNNIDKLTKVLLAVVAVALCMIALNPWLRPVVVEAQDMSDSHLRRISLSLDGIEQHVSIISMGSSLDGIEQHVSNIANGLCLGAVCRASY